MSWTTFSSTDCSLFFFKGLKREAVKIKACEFGSEGFFNVGGEMLLIPHFMKKKKENAL